MSDEITLGEINRTLEGFAKEVRAGISEIKTELGKKASAIELAELKGELKSQNERVSELERQNIIENAKEAKAVEQRDYNNKRANRRLTIIYSLGIIVLTCIEVLVHIFVK